jgi:hypothetical protein
VTEAEWLEDTTRLVSKAASLTGRVGSVRRARLFACACCHRVWHLIQVEAARRIVELAEAVADGEATAEELKAAENSPCFSDLEARVYGEAEPRLSRLAYEVTLAAKWLADPKFDMGAAGAVAEQTAVPESQDFFLTPEDKQKKWIEFLTDEGEVIQVQKFLHDIFGNPFRPVAFKPEWRTPTVLDLASQMYQSRDFSAMPILADALQDAGCDSEEILSHSLGEGPHVRGCWVVDLILGK